MTMGIVLALVMAGSTDLNAQRGMGRMRMDTVRMMRPQVRMDTSRMMRPRAPMNLPGRPGWNHFNRPGSRGMFGVRPAPPMYGRGRGFGQGPAPRMWRNQPGRGYRAPDNIPNLTDKQKEEIRDLRSKQQEEMQKLRDESAKKMQELRDSHRKKMLDILSDEQKTFVESRQVR